jgi:hypothetical protein
VMIEDKGVILSVGQELRFRKCCIGIYLPR